MKKLVLLFAAFITCFISYGQGGFQTQKKEIIATDIKENVDLLQKACNNTLNVGTPNNWTPIGSVTTNVSTFYNHTNWLAINNPQAKTYQFKRLFYIGRAGTYTISVKGMGDNRMVLKVNNITTVFDKDITVAAGFTTPATATVNVELQCGMNELNAEITNYGIGAGFYLDGTISSKNGCISDEMLACEVLKEVCRCPQGWVSNTNQQDGGIVTGTDGCKKGVCDYNVNLVPPKNGTVIGDPANPWGFTWGNALYVWGTKANGGSAKCKKEWVFEKTNSNVKPGEGRGGK